LSSFLVSKASCKNRVVRHDNDDASFPPLVRFFDFLPFFCWHLAVVRPFLVFLRSCFTLLSFFDVPTKNGFIC